MAAQDDNARRPGVFGWTAMHSWIFLGIIAVGLLIVVVQNRFHYISPLGLGKAYRIDKLFGGIQEFDPDKGWVKAQIQNPQAQPPMSMMQPPMQPGGPSLPAQVPGMMQPPPAMEPPSTPPKPSTKPQEGPGLQPPVTQLPKEAAKPKEQAKKEIKEPTPAEKLEMFKKAFPDYGKEEFALANDDLYPDWKKKAAPSGTWSEFLQVYDDFVQWWNDHGQPAEPGMKLWNDFLASRPKR